MRVGNTHCVVNILFPEIVCLLGTTRYVLSECVLVVFLTSTTRSRGPDILYVDPTCSEEEAFPYSKTKSLGFSVATCLGSRTEARGISNTYVKLERQFRQFSPASFTLKQHRQGAVMSLIWELLNITTQPTYKGGVEGSSVAAVIPANGSLCILRQSIS